MAKLSIRDLDLRGKRLFLRVDFNVPLEKKDGKMVITSDKRIKASLATIEYALDQGAAVIVASHLGRPKGKVNPDMSLRPAAACLEQLLGGKVKVAMAPDCIGGQVAQMLPEPGEVLVLENLRFHPEEENNDPESLRQRRLRHRASRSRLYGGHDRLCIEGRGRAADGEGVAIPRQSRHQPGTPLCRHSGRGESIG